MTLGAATSCIKTVWLESMRNPFDQVRDSTISPLGWVGASITFIALLAIPILVATFFIAGSLWVTEHALPILSSVSLLMFVLVLFVFLPLWASLCAGSIAVVRPRFGRQRRGLGKKSTRS